jgi:hypothetical protein
MDEEEWVRKLRASGSPKVYVWGDGPNAFCPEHTHPGMTAHVVLEREMSVPSSGA